MYENWSDQLTWGIAWLRTHWLKQKGITFYNMDNKGKRWMLIGRKNDGSMVGVAIIPRDHHKLNPNEMTMLKTEYKVINEMYSKHDDMERYILLTRTYKKNDIYLEGHAFHVIIPDNLCQTYIVKSSKQIDLGFTEEQQKKWMKEGVEYTSFSPSRNTPSEAMNLVYKEERNITQINDIG